ncbi:retrovirus-related pol polyprotein from transposon TNT 1-94 [Tanacetum coccineum]|uniref:Retrovirus-related pol polyprotein from transposon TNT 1-94 n=1 Tax=Tanacetum coccineum TaxID=301880 RepID=A0ABQ4XDG0_9ASTR
MQEANNVGSWECSEPMRLQDSDYFKDKMLLMVATTQTMFIANLTSEDPIYDEAGPSYDSNNPFEDCPTDYSKENLLATFAPQRNLTLEQIFWSIDDNARKKAETSVPKPISALTAVQNMTGNRSNAQNFVDKAFIGTSDSGMITSRAIMGYGDYVVVSYRILFSISIDDMMKSSPIGLLSKVPNLVRGLPRLKFEKDHLCSACQLGKSKKFSHKPKSENTNMEVLHTLHMDLCGPMRVQSIKGKKYILVIVDDYSRFTWVKFLRSKDETPEFVINFLKQIQVGLNKTVRFIRTDNGTEFVNQVMSEYYEGVGIFHQKSVPRTPQQNGIAEAVATACYTQNRSLIHTRHNKTPYELVHDKKPDLTFLRVFGALCYPTNDSEDLGKFQAKADIGIFVGYAPSRKGYRIYNKRTRRLMETIHVTFDEMHQTMAPVRMSSGPEPFVMTPGQLKSGLAPTDKELEMLFQPMFDEYLEQSRVNEPVPSATEVNAQVVPPGTSLSTTIAQDAPSTSASSSTSDMHHPVRHQGIAEEPTHEDSPINHDVLHPPLNPVTGEPGSAQSSSGNVNSFIIKVAVET